MRRIFLRILSVLLVLLEKSDGICPEVFGVVGYLFEPGRNRYALRAVREACAAGDASVGLTKAWHTVVVAEEETAPCLAILGVSAVAGHIALVDAAVVVQQDGWNIQSIGARHTVFAVVARHGGVLQHSLGGIFQ